ncbi:MAG: hypothetical protein L6416_00180 [Candidatus Omnitrophica bacterium]|nr:hypothetical protein [Candidatus Omnitrophota bacterium]
MKSSILLHCLIAVLCLIITLTALTADNADLSIKTRSERELRELEQSELRCVQTKQVILLSEYCFLIISKRSTFNGFLSYTQHNYQPQAQSCILCSYSIHSPPIKHYS